MASYGFIPWLRQGIGNKIITPTSGRATAAVEITYKGEKPNTTGTVTKSMQMIGPGDIVGIDPDVIVRREPANGVFDFESNYFPYIEFYDEDFPWRYSPYQNPTDGKLMPWLALVVLKDDEVVEYAPYKPGMLSYFDYFGGSIEPVMHPPGEHWAWAHVHVHKPNSTGGTYTANFKTDLLNDPDVAVSRLMCPRRLEPNTRYNAYLIPAFESGRLAGLGEDPAGAASPTTMSWPNNFRYPIYAKWRFGTSAQGDFETLVRRLKPIIAQEDWAGKKMDIAHSGVQILDDVFVADPLLPQTVLMEGALMPPAYADTTAHLSMEDASSSDAFTATLKDDVLNLADTMKQPAFTAPNPFIPGNFVEADPVVLPPMYGQMHANVTKISEPGSPKWFQNLNLDIRYRAAAGLGASVVRTRQEQLMAAAWQQIGDVLAANDKIEKAKAARAASQAVYNKHIVASNFKSGTNVITGVETIFKLGTQILKRIQVDDPTVPGGTGKSSAARLASMSSMAKGPTDTAFRKITRNRSYQVEKFGVTKIKNALYENLDRYQNPTTTAKDVNLVRPVAVSVLAEFTSGASASGQAYNSTPGMTVADFKQVYYWQKQKMNDTLQFYEEQEKPFTYAPVSLTQSPGTVNGNTVYYVGFNFYHAIFDAINPDIAITDRVRQQIDMQLNGIVSKPGSLKTVLAYPVLDEPTYDDLIKISPEYLLPNPEKYPDNSVTLLETNQRFIEAFMVGLNHEFARELLWREYPTDQQGSYFKRFWDIKDSIDDPLVFDINNIHEWPINNDLGENHTAKHVGSRIVVLIKGELFKKFPDALVYLQKAKLDNGKRILETATSSNLMFPLFRANLQPDITLVGFNITVEDVKGTINSSTDPGWFIIFRERPGQVRFGMDEPMTGVNYSTPPNDWNNLNWGHMGASSKTAIITALSTSISRPVNAQASPPLDNVTWGAHSAAMAKILYQRPSMVAIHADDMIKEI